ncbi:MAG TPA: GTP-binding protein, partial [Candidatus Paceibacterota bacterium]|nr:GTP-binding protein [Candidatus Paceibacterota bacterium]
MAHEKPNFNIVFVGHVDHGKSTGIGRLMYDSGLIPEQEMK